MIKIIARSFVYTRDQIKSALHKLNSSDCISFDEVKVNYKVLCKKYHPDQSKQDSRKFIQIQNAYDILKSTYVNDPNFLRNIKIDNQYKSKQRKKTFYEQKIKKQKQQLDQLEVVFIELYEEIFQYPFNHEMVKYVQAKESLAQKFDQSFEIKIRLYKLDRQQIDIVIPYYSLAKNIRLQNKKDKHKKTYKENPNNEKLSIFQFISGASILGAIYLVLKWEKEKTYDEGKVFRDLDTFKRDHDLKKKILDESFIDQVKNKYPIKALNRNNAGSVLMENTIWKDLEVYVIGDQSDLYDQRRRKYILMYIKYPSARKKISKVISKKLIKKVDFVMGSNYASIALEIERRMSHILISKEQFLNQLETKGQLELPLFFMDFQGNLLVKVSNNRQINPNYNIKKKEFLNLYKLFYQYHSPLFFYMNKHQYWSIVPQKIHNIADWGGVICFCSKELKMKKVDLNRFQDILYLDKPIYNPKEPSEHFSDWWSKFYNETSPMIDIKRNRRILKLKNEGQGKPYTDPDMKKFRFNSLRYDLLKRDKQNEEELR